MEADFRGIPRMIWSGTAIQTVEPPERFEDALFEVAGRAKTAFLPAPRNYVKADPREE